MSLWPLGLMVALFILLFARLKWPLGLALAAAALAGGLVQGVPLWDVERGGMVEPGSSIWRHLAEGGFVYIDPILIMVAAFLFMRVIEENGLLKALTWWILRGLGRRPAPLAVALGLFVAFPGMLTGLSTASVLTTGAIAAPPLMRMGLDARRAGAFIAVAAILGVIAPPVNLPAMIICAGVDMPYLGFMLPLALIAFPLLAVCSLWLAWGPLRRGDAAAALAGLDRGPIQRHGAWLLLPLAVVAALMAGPRLFPAWWPSPGMPATLLAGTLAGLVTGDRVRLPAAARQALRQALPVMGILVGVGCFIQILTLTGQRGELVLAALRLPAWAAWLGIALSLPAFGAVSALGSASVLGVPFLLALLGRPEIWVCAGLSALAALGDLMPPAALACTFSAQVTGEPSHFRVLRRSLGPALLTAAWALGLIAASPWLARLAEGR
jgi:TRAP-type C4-dicarboxylate transport system permease large subunit